MSSAYKSATMRHQPQSTEESSEGVPVPPSSLPRATIASSSAVPSRDSVSAAIALVRAKQAAKAGKQSAVHKVHTLDDLRLLRVSNKITTAQQHLLQQQQKHRSLQQKRQQQQPTILQSENTTPKPSISSPGAAVDAPSEDRRTPLSPRAEQHQKPAPTVQQKQQRPVRDSSETLFSMVNDVFSSRSETQPLTSSKRPPDPARRTFDTFDPFDQTDFSNIVPTRKSSVRMAQVARLRAVSKTNKEEIIMSSAPALADSTSTVTAHSLPSMPSMRSEDEGDADPKTKGYERSGFSRSMSETGDDEDGDIAEAVSDEELPEIDEKTMADVNAFLDKLGVRLTPSKDNSVTDSIEKLRSLSSDGSSSTIGEVEPETMAEISAFIDNISKKGKDSVIQRLTAEEQRLAKDAEDKKQQAQLAVEVASKFYQEISLEEPLLARRHLGDAPSTMAEEKKVDEPVVIKQIRSDDSAEAEVQVRTSRPSPIYELMEEVQHQHHGLRRDPPSTLPYEGPVHKADPPGPPTPPSPASRTDTELSHAVMQMHQEGEDMVAPSYSVESLDSSPPASVVLEEDKKSEDDEDEMGDEDYSKYIDTSFAANVRKTLSTVVEATSADEETVEAAIPSKEVIHLEDFNDDDDDEEEEEGEEGDANYDNMLLEALGTNDEASPRHSVLEATVDSPRHSIYESLVQKKSEEGPPMYEDNGKKEPRGDYDYYQDNLEKAHRDERVKGNLVNGLLTPASPSSASLGSERYESLEQEKEEDVQKELKEISQQLQEYTIDVDKTDSEIESSVTGSAVPEDLTSEAQSEDDSAAWALRDIASEETMRATGRTRHHFVVSGRRPSKSSRVIASLLSDDTSVQPSEVIGEALIEVKEVEEEELSSDEESYHEQENARLPETSGTSEVGDVDEAEIADNVDKIEVEDDDEHSDNDDEIEDDSINEADQEDHDDDNDDYESVDSENDLDIVEEEQTHTDDVDDVQIAEEGFEITAPSSLFGQDEGPDCVLKDESEDFLDGPFSEIEEGNSASSDSINELHLGRDPSGDLGRNVNYTGNEVKKPDPDAFEPEILEKQKNIEIDNKIITIEEKEDEIDGTPVIHILTSDSRAGASMSFDSSKFSEPEEPAVEVGQGHLSPTRLTEFVSTVDRHKIQGDNHAEKIKNFKKLIVPLVDGHKPTLVESAGIRQAALKAGIDLGIVDEFLDYVGGDETPAISPATTSEDEQELLIKSFEVEQVNEDEAIAEFLARVEQARVAAAEAVAAATAAAIEATKQESTKEINEAGSAGAFEIPEADEVPTVDDDLGEKPLSISNTFLEQFEDLKLDEGIEAVGSTSHVQVLSSPTSCSVVSRTAAIGSVDSVESNTRIETPAFEVGQGLLSPTRLSEFLAVVDRQHDGKNEPKEMVYFKSLIVPIVDGHKPSIVEVAQIRQAAFKANVPLNLVDNFLDYANDQDAEDEEEVHHAGSSFDGEKSLSLIGLDNIEDHNDDQAIAAFLSRIEKARAAAEEAAIALESQAEAALQAKATLEAQSALDAASPRSNPFITSFEELGVQEEDTQNSIDDQFVRSQKRQTAVSFPLFEGDQGPMSPTKLAAFFAEIDKHHSSEKENDLKHFKELIIPVVNGHKPTIIEEARIRQAALKANVPLGLVDTFVGYVKNDHPELSKAASSKDLSLFLKSWDDVEDVNEDEAIAGFLSRFQSQKGDEKNSTSASVLEEKVSTPREIIDVIAEDQATTVQSVLHTYAGSGIDGSRSRNVPITEVVKSKEEDEEPWWKHAGSPNAANAASFGSRSEEWNANHFSTDLEDCAAGPKSSVTEVSKRRKKLSIDTALNGSKSKVAQKFDEEIWRRRTAMATYGWGWEEATWLSPRSAGKGPVGIDGVTAVEGLTNFMFNKDSFVFARRNWSLSYKQRTKEHSGYFDVHVNSLLESATFGEGHWPKDDTPWELRYVRQRFLHERSLSFSRNWFGTLEMVNGNDKIKAPVCKPKSMEMPMENIPEDGQWDVEWYTTWSARKNMPKPPPATATITTATEGEDTTYESEYGSEESSEETGSYTDTSTDIEDDDGEWEDAPECGTLVNVKQKIGERITRVHPDYTSSLRRSRWRKKYFPKGSFPY
ncbi:hypothetical protein IV203_000006 [Nitzschia inconspicua]|uniref:Uncharacterized protein n=2 Tax=Nitzschia inconspicua TaxID=303405 RepID=A0A9K3K5I5_9STRA|nr:hypothetical protein IV203_000006 [Nitzschia inconspicua]